MKFERFIEFEIRKRLEEKENEREKEEFSGFWSGIGNDTFYEAKGK